MIDCFIILIGGNVLTIGLSIIKAEYLIEQKLFVRGLGLIDDKIIITNLVNNHSLVFFHGLGTIVFQ
jgi:hypothetical protein